MGNQKEVKLERWKIILLVVLLLLFVVVIGAVMYWEHVILPQNSAEAGADALQTMPTTQTMESTPLVTEAPTEATEPTVPAETLIKDGMVRLMLVGQDTRDDGSRERSDTMILCVFDTNAKKLTMISFLRDIYLPIPGHSSSRLNASYSWGGFDLLNSTLKQNFGVEVDGDIELNFYGFMDLIDYLGGVDIELTAKEANYLNNRNFSDIGGTNDWTLHEGMNHLDGTQALAYSRVRQIDSDFYRTERQRNVLIAILERFKTASVEELINAMDMLLNESVSNLSDDMLLGYALELYPMLAECEVVTQHIPADGTWKYATIKGMSVIDVDLEANREICAQLMSPETDDQPDAE